jgi:hypothetical protein
MTPTDNGVRLVRAFGGRSIQDLPTMDTIRSCHETIAQQHRSAIEKEMSPLDWLTPRQANLAI